jgi:hypothetical protein
MAPLNQLNGLANGRKDCVLHARIPPALDNALRQKAQEMNIPVSRLIRDLLVNAMTDTPVLDELVMHD